MDPLSPQFGQNSGNEPKDTTIEVLVFAASTKDAFSSCPETPLLVQISGLQSRTMALSRAYGIISARVPVSRQDSEKP